MGAGWGGETNRQEYCAAHKLDEKLLLLPACLGFRNPLIKGPFIVSSNSEATDCAASQFHIL